MSSQSAFDLCNRALVRVGASQIVDFEGGSAESESAAAEYEARVTERLSGVMPGWPPPGGAAFEWRFSMKIAALGAPVGTAPADLWTHAYNLPADMLALRACRRSDLQIEFTRAGNQLLCNDEANVVVEYTFRQTEANFPPYFTAALVEDLAEFFALALNRDTGLATAHRERAVSLWAAARFADSKAMTPRVVKASRVLSVRF
jgi:hypothetical protein